MPLNGSYSYDTKDGKQESYAFSEIEGYRISAALSPEGFGRSFYVHIFDRWEAAHRAQGPIKFGKREPRGELQLAEQDERKYVFSNIVLRGAIVGVTRRERFREWEFSYDQEALFGEKFPINLENASDDVLEEGELGDDYTYKLAPPGGGGGEEKREHLLGFSARLSANRNVILRFVAKRNKYNSFLESAIKLHKSKIEGAAKKRMANFKIELSAGEILIKPANLVMFYVEELYGDMIRARLPHLAAIGPKHEEKFSTWSLEEHSVEELLEHNYDTAFPGNRNHENIEVATIVLKGGTVPNLELT